MTVRQKRAIGYHIRQKEYRSMDRLIQDYRLTDDFLNSGYKTKRWFLRSLLGKDKNLDENIFKAMRGKY